MTPEQIRAIADAIDYPHEHSLIGGRIEIVRRVMDAVNALGYSITGPAEQPALDAPPPSKTKPPKHAHTYGAWRKVDINLLTAYCTVRDCEERIYRSEQ